jgi:uncharacterized membrane protein YvlD (DUF360 family)
MKRKVRVFVGFWVINLLVLYLGYMVGTGSIVLGNASLTPVSAAIITGLLLTIIIFLVQPVLDILKIKAGDEKSLNLIYLVLNIVGLWVLARLAAYTGFGIVRFWVAIILGIIVTFFQLAFEKYLVKKIPIKS